MTTFTSAHEAKEFLIDLIVQEAQQESVPLSETERKMLYFSESASTLTDIDQVSADFERDYDQAEYERRIATIVWTLKARLKRENPEELKAWDGAVRQLRKEDHYLLVLIDAAKPPTRAYTLRSPIVWLVALAITFVGIVILYLLPLNN